MPLTVREAFGNALESNVLAAMAGSSIGTFYIPHFASGGSYSTELTLINAQDAPASIRIKLIE